MPFTFKETNFSDSTVQFHAYELNAKGSFHSILSVVEGKFRGTDLDIVSIRICPLLLITY